MSRFRSRKHILPISFFAFQDIITSLAGTLLIIVLIIVCKNNSPPPEADSSRQVSCNSYEKLQSAVNLQTRQLEQQMQKISKLRQILATGEQANKNAEKQKTLLRMTGQLESAERDYRRQLEKLQQQLRKLQLQERDTLLADKTLLQKAQLAEKLEKQIAEKMFRLQIAPAGDRQTFLLDLSRGSWLWQSHGTAPVKLGKNSNSPADAVHDLREKLKNIPTQSRLVIAVRPSAGKFIRALRELILRENPGLEVLAEPLPNENSGGIDL